MSTSASPQLLLRMTPGQARIAADACEVVARVRCGELESVAAELLEHAEGRVVKSESLKSLHGLLVSLKPLVTQLPGGSHHALDDPIVPESARRAHLCFEALDRALRPHRVRAPGAVYLGIRAPEVRMWAGAVEMAMDEAAAQVVSESCEMLARIHMGQLGYLYDVIAFDAGRAPIEDLHRCKDALDNQGSSLVTGMHHPGASYGISSREVADRARIAFDIHKVVRHRLYRMRNTQGSRMSVHAHIGARLSEAEPLATMEVLSEAPPVPSQSLHRR